MHMGALLQAHLCLSPLVCRSWMMWLPVSSEYALCGWLTLWHKYFWALECGMLLVIFVNGWLCSGIGRGRQKWAKTGRNWQKQAEKGQKTGSYELLRLQTIKAIADSRSFKSPKSDEPRRVQVLDLYCVTIFLILLCLPMSFPYF